MRRTRRGARRGARTGARRGARGGSRHSPFLRPSTRARLGAGRGFTLVEAIIAMAIVGLLALATGNTARVIFATQDEQEENGLVDELGISLLEEVASLPFNDPQNGGTSLGPEFGEWVPLGNRALLDDVDDYTVWTGTRPLQQKNGALIHLPGYTRSVSVCYVNPVNFTLASFTPTDCKEITVTVLYNGTPVKTYSTVRIEGGRYVDSDG
jgi:prepilin-type N-terminal cleavage/methylation domain-containing protein